MLYQTGVEYGDYTMNHVQGCAHGCKYCYANTTPESAALQYQERKGSIQPSLL